VAMLTGMGMKRQMVVLPAIFSVVIIVASMLRNKFKYGDRFLRCFVLMVVGDKSGDIHRKMPKGFRHGEPEDQSKQ
jgi:hypothetical protein